MLRESDFYAAYEKGERPARLNLTEKVEKLFARFEEGIRSLFDNRQKRLSRQRGLFKKFTAGGDFVVDQSTMRFVP